MNVDDVIRIKIQEAARKVEAARQRRADMQAARQRGLAYRHAAKLRHQARTDGQADHLCTDPAAEVLEGPQSPTVARSQQDPTDLPAGSQSPAAASPRQGPANDTTDQASPPMVMAVTIQTDGHGGSPAHPAGEDAA